MSNTLMVNSALQTKLLSHGNNKYTFEVSPIAPGYGHTLGNSLRRILLSSIPGYAVTSITINDNITHEYQSIEGVVEDALEIILNIKNLAVKVKTDEETVVITGKKKGAGDFLARDFDVKNGQYEITNPDLYICTLDADGSVEFTVELTKGYGYLPLERLNMSDNPDPRKLLVDALFSPITNVSLEINDVRVGEMTNYNKLSINFETNGTVDPKEAVEYALKANIESLQDIANSFGKSDVSEKASVTDGADMKVAEDNNAVSSENLIKLPKKILNILNKNEIITNQDLIENKEKISDLAGLDEKMIASIDKYISKLDK